MQLREELRPAAANPLPRRSGRAVSLTYHMTSIEAMGHAPIRIAVLDAGRLQAVRSGSRCSNHDATLLWQLFVGHIKACSKRTWAALLAVAAELHAVREGGLQVRW